MSNTNYIEKQANQFGDAFQTKVIDKLISIINDRIDLDKALAEANALEIEETNKQIEELCKDATPEQVEEYKQIKPRVREFKDSVTKFQFAFDQLLKSGHSLLHDVDAAGQLHVKIYKLEETRIYKFKSKYSVDLENI